MGPAFQVEILPAPGTPLNLQLGVIYAPRVPHGLFVAYECREVGLGEFAIFGYDATRQSAIVWRGRSLGEAWHRFAKALEMTR